jgi:hypothetical protein
VTVQRSQAVAFSAGLDQVFNRFFVPNPVGSINLGVYKAPFTTTSWLAILIFNIVIPPLIYFSTK